MDTLLIGDYIMVNRFLYAPTTFDWERKLLPVRDLKRGDVIVFKYPNEPEQDYIKRLVGLPGDHIVVREKRVYVNGVPQAVTLDGIYEGFGHTGAQVALEQLGEVPHRVLYIPGRPSYDFDAVVPPGHFFMMGDNRDNSRDSRFPEVGFVPEDLIVGKAVRIWLNWNLPNAPIWSRIGGAIH